MNDFTKSELKTLPETLDNLCDQYQKSDEIYQVRDKIQSMIDDYIMIDCYREQNNKKLIKEEIRKTFCCGKELFYSHVNWSIAKCSDCGREFNE